MLYTTHTHRLGNAYGVLRAAELLHEGGFSGIDLSLYKPKGEAFSDDYKRVADELVAFSKSSGLVLHQGHAPYCRYELYKDTVEPFMPRAFEFFGRIGVSYVVVHPMYYPEVYRGREEEIFELNVAYYRSLMPYAKEYGFKIAAENMWIYHPVTKAVKPSYLSDPSEMKRLFEAVDSPDSFTMCLDLGHSAIAGYEPDEVIRALGKDILGCMHAQDVDYLIDWHTLPGVGKLNWDRICKALGEIDYQGSFNLEADNFYSGFDKDFYPTVTRFMADTARCLAERAESYRIKK
jgi:sugar phosphate isomerase/epimerase